MDQNSTTNSIITSAINLCSQWQSRIVGSQDIRTEGMLFVDSPVPTFGLMLGYLLIVWIGPKIMQNRKPFELKRILLIYNCALVMLNLYILNELLDAAISLKYNLICEPSREIFSTDEFRIINAIWWFYLSKCIEFCDSFFFILRKKNNQLTFLHVYHHSTVFPLWWSFLRHAPTGSTFLPAAMNSFVHILMYTYYGLSAIGPNVAKHLPKKHLTIIQLIQFTLFLIEGINGLLIDCEYPTWIKCIEVIYTLSFLVLFGQFYVISYLSSASHHKSTLDGCVMAPFEERVKLKRT